MRAVLTTLAVAALAVGLSASLPLQAQAPYHLAGKEMPLHDAVDQFFSTGCTLCFDGWSSCQDLMAIIGIPLDSPVREAVRNSLQRFGKLIKWGPSRPKTITCKVDGGRKEVMAIGTTFPTPGIALEASPEQRSAAIMKVELDKARELGRIYRDLRNSMTAAGISCATMDDFIENSIRPGMGVSSDGPFDEQSYLRQTARAFDGGFAEPPPPRDQHTMPALTHSEKSDHPMGWPTDRGLS